MTKIEKSQVMERVVTLLRTHNEAVIASVTRKMASGGINMDEYDLTDYSLPKVLLTSALYDHKDYFTPLYGPWQEDIKNLNYF